MAMTKARSATTNDMRDSEQQDLLQDWDRMAPVGREFGSPDYERLEELDHLAILAKGSMLAARRWLDTPNQALDGMTPEEVAKTPEGFARVRQLLTSPSKA
jgi:uncharacterized protein (DUF2384 family)